MLVLCPKQEYTHLHRADLCVLGRPDTSARHTSRSPAQQVWQCGDSLGVVFQCLYAIWFTLPACNWPILNFWLFSSPAIWQTRWACGNSDILIPSQQNSQVGKDEKSRKIRTWGSSPCWKRWVDSPVPVQQPFAPLLLFAAMPHLMLVLSWVPRLFRKIRFSSKHTSELAWHCPHTHPSSQHISWSCVLAVPLSLVADALKCCAWSHFTALWGVFYSAPLVFPTVNAA